MKPMNEYIPQISSFERSSAFHFLLNASIVLCALDLLEPGADDVGCSVVEDDAGEEGPCEAAGVLDRLEEEEEEAAVGTSDDSRDFFFAFEDSVAPLD